MAEPAPDELTLRRQLESVPFLSGVETGRWEVLELDFPALVVRVNGSNFTGDVQASMEFQLVCDNFPVRGPFVQLWDFAARCRPSPPDVSKAPFALVDAFKEWSRDDHGGYGGIYRGWQRYAALHNGWAQKYPEDAWRRDRPLTFIMEKLYGLVSEQADWLALRAAA